MILPLAFFAICAAVLALLLPLRKHRANLTRIGQISILAGAVLLLINFILRSMRLKFPALTNSYEALLLLAMVLLWAVIVLQWKEPSPPILLGSALLALVLLLLASSPVFSQELKPPVPALQSHWLVLHVSFAFIGEALFGVAFVTALLWFTSKDSKKQEIYHRMIYRSILVGYGFYTLGALIFGAVWAYHSWGRFWGWDPKETWALITWLCYTLYLHSRLSNQKPRWTNGIALVGFVLTLITFLGLRWLSGAGQSLHEY